MKRGLVIDDDEDYVIGLRFAKKRIETEIAIRTIETTSEGLIPILLLNKMRRLPFDLQTTIRISSNLYQMYCGSEEEFDKKYYAYLCSKMQDMFIYYRRECIATRYAFGTCLIRMGIIKDMRVLMMKHLILLEEQRERFDGMYSFCIRYFVSRRVSDIRIWNRHKDVVALPSKLNAVLARDGGVCTTTKRVDQAKR